MDGIIIAIAKRVPIDEKIAEAKLDATTTNSSQNQYADRDDLPLKLA